MDSLVEAGQRRLERVLSRTRKFPNTDDLEFMLQNETLLSQALRDAAVWMGYFPDEGGGY